MSIRAILFAVLLLLGLSPAQPVHAAADATSTATDGDEIEHLLQALEDPQRRARLIAALRAGAAADNADPATPGAAAPATFHSAAAELLQALASRIGDLTRTATDLLRGADDLPRLLDDGLRQLQDPAARERWLAIAFNLVLVLGGGWLAAHLARAAVGRLRRQPKASETVSFGRRLLRLLAALFAELVPLIAFALGAFAALTFSDPRPDTRLVALALVNASIVTRLLRVISTVVFAPRTPELRLWPLQDETAHYLDQWSRRLSVISVYGFFGLQAALLLGMGAGAYELGLHLLGLLLVGLLLVLIAQNRDNVANAVAAEAEPDSDEPRSVSSLRKGIARIWHLVASLYLVAIYLIWVLQVEDGALFVLKATLISFAVVAIARVLMRVINRLFERGLRLSADLGSQFPGLESRLNRYFPLLRKFTKFLLVAFASLLILDAWGIDALGWFAGATGGALIAALVNIGLIIAVSVVVWEFASGGIERYLSESDTDGNLVARSPRVRTLLTVARNALLVLLAVVSTLMVLSELGINIAPLLAGAGVVGLAIGFGAQRLVQDVINGAFILFQDLMSVGDVVKLGDKAGLVEALSIRTVRLRDLAGVVHTIPFSAIEGVSNLTREFSFHVFDLGIAYREDVDEVVALIHEIGAELQADPEIGPLVLEPLEVFGLDAFGNSAIVIKGRIKTRPIRQWQVGRAFNRLVKIRFDERGIEIPFPHTTLYFGQDKDGSAPPAFVQLEAMLRESGAPPSQAAPTAPSSEPAAKPG